LAKKFEGDKRGAEEEFIGSGNKDWTGSENGERGYFG